MRFKALFLTLALCLTLSSPDAGIAQKSDKKSSDKKSSDKKSSNKKDQNVDADQEPDEKFFDPPKEKRFDPPKEKLFKVDKKDNVHPLVSQIENAIVLDQLIEPPGVCAYDLYQILLKNVPSEPSLKSLSERLGNLLAERGTTPLTSYAQGGNAVFTRADWARAEIFIARARELKPKVKELKVVDLFYQGMVALGDKQPAKAEDLFRQGLKQDDKAAYLYNGLGRALSEQKDDEQSLKAYNRAAQLAPQWTFPLVNAALKYLRKGDLPQAQKNALTAINIDNNDIEAHSILASIYTSLGNYEEAVKEYNIVLLQRPRSVNDRINYGRLLIEMNDYTGAENVLAGAAQISPLDARVQLYLSIVIKRRAESAFTPALDRVKAEATKPNADLSWQLAMAEGTGAEGNRAETIAAYRSVTKQEPWHANLRLRLAQLLIEDNRGSEAIDEYRDIIKLYPNNREAHTALGTALRKIGETKTAISEYRKAVQIDPAYTAARYNLATLLQDSGDLEAAAIEYRAILTADPNNQSVLSALKGIEARLAPKNSPEPAPIPVPTPVNPEPKPVNTETKPVNTEAKPVNTEAKPPNTESQPANTEPVPTNTQPQPANTQVQPLETENKVVKSETDSTTEQQPAQKVEPQVAPTVEPKVAPQPEEKPEQKPTAPEQKPADEPKAN